MEKSSRIYVAGHRGLVGSAILRGLERRGFTNLLYRSRAELDLESHDDVMEFFERERPDYVFLAAARVGGILANATYPAEFIRSNMLIPLNVVHAAHQTKTTKLLYLGSSCIYPKHARQPITEDQLLSGPLEPTNEPYAIAKIAGIQLCQSYRRQYGMNCISVMPTNLYGPGDNFDLQTSHVMPALLRKFHDAKVAGQPTVSVWGSGTPRREFLHVDDMADACIFLMDQYESDEIINVGCGEDVSIAELTQLVSDAVGFTGSIEYDRSKPDGTPRKLLDVSRIRALGWAPRIPLDRGIAETYRWYLEHRAAAATNGAAARTNGSRAAASRVAGDVAATHLI